jgi:hypothetical protein
MAERSMLSGRALPLLAVTGLAALAAYEMNVLLRPSPDTKPQECTLQPVAHHPGTLVAWTLGRSGPDGGGELSAKVQLDDGRTVTAYNVPHAGASVTARVVVAEIVCEHRVVHLLTDFAPPAKP